MTDLPKHFTARFYDEPDAMAFARRQAANGLRVSVQPGAYVGAIIVVTIGAPELHEFAQAVKQLCKDFSDRADRPYMGDVTAAIDDLLEQHLEGCDQ